MACSRWLSAADLFLYRRASPWLVCCCNTLLAAELPLVLTYLIVPDIWKGSVG